MVASRIIKMYITTFCQVNVPLVGSWTVKDAISTWALLYRIMMLKGSVRYVLHQFETPREKTGLRGSRPDSTISDLYSHRSRLEA